MESIKQNEKYRLAITTQTTVALISTCVLSLTLSSCSDFESSSQTTVKQAIACVDPIMGDWQGNSVQHDGIELPLVAQVIALGKGKYRAILHTEFDKRRAPEAILDGDLEGTTVRFSGRTDPYGDIDVRAIIEGDTFTGSFLWSNGPTLEMKKVVRLSPTLGAKPPNGAIVLFDGSDLDQWVSLANPSGLNNQSSDEMQTKPAQWNIVDGAIEVRPGTGLIVTKRKFTNFKLHMEFRTPFMPEARGQDRGNSGVYLQGRYEIQILDSYGLIGWDNECGGIYRIASPDVNMCAPPIQWQTYDITFHAPSFNDAGVKIENAHVTVLHNGQIIHDDAELPNPTPEALDDHEAEPGGIYFQDHDNLVQYRNIWLVTIP